jgi:hypothetical protein
MNAVVAIFTNSPEGTPIVGQVSAVDCDTVLLGPPPAGTFPPTINGIATQPVTNPTRFSLCNISAVTPLT